MERRTIPPLSDCFSVIPAVLGSKTKKGLFPLQFNRFNTFSKSLPSDTPEIFLFHMGYLELQRHMNANRHRLTCTCYKQYIIFQIPTCTHGSCASTPGQKLQTNTCGLSHIRYRYKSKELKSHQRLVKRRVKAVLSV